MFSLSFSFVRTGMKREDVYALPSGISLMLCQAIQATSENPPPGWSSDVYRFIGRLDLCLPLTINSSTPSKTPIDEEKLSDQVSSSIVISVILK